MIPFHWQLFQWCWAVGEVWGWSATQLWIETSARQSKQQTGSLSDTQMYTFTCEPTDGQMKLQACSVQPNVKSANHPTTTVTWRHYSWAHHKSRGMCTKSSVLRNHGSGNTMVGLSRDSQLFSGGLCVVHCLFSNEHNTCWKNSLACWCVYENTKMHKQRDQFEVSDRGVTPSNTCFNVTLP